MGRPVHKQKIDNQINKPINKLTSLSLNSFTDQTDSKIFTKIRYVVREEQCSISYKSPQILWRFA